MQLDEPILPDGRDDASFRIAFLIAGFIKETLTEEEHIELDDWVNASLKNQLLFEELTEENNVEKLLEWKKNLNVEQAAEGLKSKINFETKKIRLDIRSLLPHLTVAAAAITAILVIAVFRHKKFVEIKSNSVVLKDLRPGSPQATLETSSGFILKLDTIKKGSFGQEQNTQIVKTASNELLYITSPKSIIPKEESFNVLSTPKGGIYNLVLSDGTRVWLDAASSIRYPVGFLGHDRKITLSGEAYFEVAKDSLHPFIVIAAGTETKVLGTHFNVNAYGDDKIVKITLEEGSVEINNRVRILPGEQANIDQNKEIEKSKVDLETELAWKKGLFIFKNTPIRQIMLQISRWYNADIEFADNINPHFNTTISRDLPVSKLLHLLEATGSVRFQIIGQKIIIMQ
jgi:transmembrane sensor